MLENPENLKILAEWLEAGAPHEKGVNKFDMRNWIEPNPTESGCGTACCIAGAAVQFFNEDHRTFKDYDDVVSGRPNKWKYLDDYAQELLGLDAIQAEELFRAENLHEFLSGGSICHQTYIDMLSSITPAWAARCIRKLIATGKVDWIGTREA